MSTNVIMPSEIEMPITSRAADRVGPLEPKPRRTRWVVVAIQVLALMAYGMGLAFLLKTTVGTLVMFSLLAPALVAVAVIAVIVVGIHEFRRRHGISDFAVYDRGQIIFRQGELGDCAYFIQSGEVEVIHHINGLENVIATLSEGEYFGEKALISSAPRAATIRAATQTRVGIIRKRRFLTMIIVLPVAFRDVTADTGRFGKRARKYAS